MENVHLKCINWSPRTLYKVGKDLELKEFRIDSNGKESKKSDKSLKKLEIKRLPKSDGEFTLLFQNILI